MVSQKNANMDAFTARWFEEGRAKCELGRSILATLERQLSTGTVDESGLLQDLVHLAAQLEDDNGPDAG